VNKKIYAIGGRGTDGMVLSFVEEYDPSADKWTRKTDIPTARCSFSTSVVNGKIYAIGGAKVFSAISDFSPVDEYNPLTDTWIKKTDMPTARADLSTSVLNQKIHAVGGTIGPWGPVLSLVEEYNPTTDTWDKKADMPTARGYLSTSTVNDKIYVIGGTTKCGPSCASIILSTVEEYDAGGVSAK
jgi:N-acetylneuraminic acid mutarotase